MSLPDGIPVDGSILSVLVAGATLLVPLTVGLVVGYLTAGPTSDRLRAGARAGLVITALATVAAGAYGAAILWKMPEYDPSALLTLIPVLGLVWLLLAGLYTVSVSVIGSVLGGYLRTQRSRRYAA